MKRHWPTRLAARLYRSPFSGPLEQRLLLARSIYIDLAAPGPTYDGGSWNTTYADRQQGRAAAVSGNHCNSG